MEFDYHDNMGTGGGNSALMGLLAGSALNKDRDDGKGMTWFAMVIVLIVFFIAIIFLALAFKDRGHDRVSNNGNYGELLATMIAAKGMDCKTGEIDKFEIMQKLEHNEDRARETQTQQEIGALGKEFAAMGFGLAGKIDNAEKEQLKTYANLENQIGMLSMGMNQLLTKSNNSDIINGVIQQLMCGKPCIG